MNVSNKLTVFRILVVPVFLCFLISRKYLLAGALFVLAAFTDYLDGKIARKNSQITDFGKLLDPVADKILTTCAYIYFVKINLVSIVPVIAMLTREFMVTGMRSLAYQKGKVIAASFLGKFKTVSQLISIILAILLLYLTVNSKLNNIFTQSIAVLFKSFVWLSVIFSVFSGIEYFLAWGKIKSNSTIP